MTDQAPTNEKKDSAEFLTVMYSAMWDNINRHILGVWQPVATVVSSVALLSLVEREVIGLDFATTMVTGFAAWLMAHTYDASAWFNRNQNIISKIEKQMLSSSMISTLGSPIGEARDMRRPILHFRIQQGLALTLWILMLSHHFLKRAYPSIDREARVDLSRLAPYGFSALAVALVYWAGWKAYSSAQRAVREPH